MRRRRRFDLSHLPTPALWALIWINASVYVLWWVAAITGPQAMAFMEAHAVVSTEAVAGGRWWTLLTSEVSHLNLLHLAANMLALGSLGADVERIVGSRGFVHLYVAGAIAASAAHVGWSWWAGESLPALGASGAVMAVAVVSALLYPSRELLLFFLVPMPAILAVFAFILLDLWGLFAPEADMIAHAAHLGGAVYGAAWFFLRLRGYVQERLIALGVRPGDEVVI